MTTLNQLLESLTNSIRGAVKTIAPNGASGADIGLICVASAVGFATSLGATKQQLEETWAEVMRSLTVDAEAETRRSKMAIVGASGAPIAAAVARLGEPPEEPKS